MSELSGFKEKVLNLTDMLTPLRDELLSTKSNFKFTHNRSLPQKRSGVTLYSANMYMAYTY